MSSLPTRHAAPNPPRPEFPRLHPDRPPPKPPGEPRNPDDPWSMIQQAATQFGVSPPTRTRSRRHSHWPMARQHCEFYFAYKVLNWSMRRIAKTSGRAVSTVHAGIHKGRKLVHDAADRQGYVDDAGVRFRHDREDIHGCRPDVETDPWALD